MFVGITPYHAGQYEDTKHYLKELVQKKNDTCLEKFSHGLLCISISSLHP